MRLTEEQRKILLAMEEEQKQAELARSKAAEAQATTQQVVQQPIQPPQQVAQQVVQPQVKPQVVEAKKTMQPKEEKKVEQTVKAEPQKKPEAAPQPQPQQQATQQSANNGERRYGLQCGAFKNKAQADTLQAKLSALGLNARVNASADWNRVIVGPAGDRNAAVKMQEKAKSVINCVVIGM